MRLCLKCIADCLQRIFSADSPLTVKVEKVVTIADDLVCRIAVQCDDVSVFINNDTKAFTPKQIIEDQMVQLSYIVGRTEKTDDCIVMEDGHAENDTGFMVNAALNGIAQCPLSGYALLKIAAVENTIMPTVVAMIKATMLDR